ncbi:MAG: TlpA family protein disulfide reductase, partial [Acidimicrobiia bacterium]
VAVAVAVILQRRRPEPPSSPSYRTIAEIDRSEFAHPGAPVLLVMFGSTTCHTCPTVWDTIESLDVPSERVDVQTDPKRHQRYRIDGVPTTIVAGADGVVSRTFFGPVSRQDLESAVSGIPGD